MRYLTRILRDAGLGGEIARGGVGMVGVAIANRVLILATAVLLARLLGPDGYGRYAYALAWALLLSVPGKLGWQTLLIREVATYHMHGDWSRLHGVLRRAVQSAGAASVAVGAALAAVTLALAPRVDAETRAALLWAAVLVPTLSIASLRGAALKGLRRVVAGEAPGMFLLPAALLAAVATYWLLDLGLDAPTAMGLHVAAAALSFLVGAVLLHRALPPQVLAAAPAYETRRWFASAVPLAVLSGARIAHRQTDIIMLGVMMAAADVGVYRVAVTGSMLVTLATDAITNQLSPYVARLAATGEIERLQRMVTTSTRVMVLLALPFAVVFVIAGGRILSTIFGAHYALGQTALAILATAQLLGVATGPTPMLLNMSGHEGRTAVSFVASAMANVVLNAILIPRAGAVGAAVATSISLLAWNALLWMDVRRHLAIDASILGMPLRRTRGADGL